MPAWTSLRAAAAPRRCSSTIETGRPGLSWKRYGRNTPRRTACPKPMSSPAPTSPMPPPEPTTPPRPARPSSSMAAIRSCAAPASKSLKARAGRATSSSSSRASMPRARMPIRPSMRQRASCGRARARSTSWLWKEHLEACIAQSAINNANQRIAVHSAAQSRKALTMRAPCFRHRGRSLSPPAGPSFSPLRERRPFLVGSCHPGSPLRPGPG